MTRTTKPLLNPFKDFLDKTINFKSPEKELLRLSNFCESSNYPVNMEELSYQRPTEINFSWKEGNIENYVAEVVLRIRGTNKLSCVYKPNKPFPEVKEDYNLIFSNSENQDYEYLEYFLREKYKDKEDSCRISENFCIYVPNFQVEWTNLKENNETTWI